jgi:hypothetical protein
MKINFSNSFKVHVSFGSFLEFTPMNIGVKKRTIKKLKNIFVTIIFILYKVTVVHKKNIAIFRII